MPERIVHIGVHPSVRFITANPIPRLRDALAGSGVFTDADDWTEWGEPRQPGHGFHAYTPIPLRSGPTNWERTFALRVRHNLKRHLSRSSSGGLRVSDYVVVTNADDYSTGVSVFIEGAPTLVQAGHDHSHIF